MARRFDHPIEPMTLGNMREFLGAPVDGPSRLGTQKQMKSPHLCSPGDEELTWKSWS